MPRDHALKRQLLRRLHGRPGFHFYCQELSTGSESDDIG